jgi:hypothetical protein
LDGRHPGYAEDAQLLDTLNAFGRRLNIEAPRERQDGGDDGGAVSASGQAFRK